MFYAWENQRGDHKGSLTERLKECGVVLDTSKATKLQSAFGYTFITEIPTIDCTGLVGESKSVFANGYSRITTIEKIIVNETVRYTTWFNNTCPVNVTFEGVIGQDIAFPYNGNLSVASMKNIISCLKNYRGTDEEFAHTLTFTNGMWTRLEADSTSPTGTTWKEYVDSLGWNT